jgi:polyhydroxyalkanoate synthesis regulator phasin
MTETPFDKGLNLGLGMFAFTREKAESFVKELIDKGKIAREDSPEVVERIVNAFSKESQNLQATLEKVVHNAVEQAGVATHTEVNELKDKLEAVSSKLDRLQAILEKSEA